MTKEEAYKLCGEWFDLAFELSKDGENNSYALQMSAFYSDIFMTFVKAEDPHYEL